MSDELSFAELDGQHVELLPARTVLSAFGILNDGFDFPVVALDDSFEYDG